MAVLMNERRDTLPWRAASANRFIRMEFVVVFMMPPWLCWFGYPVFAGMRLSCDPTARILPKG
jgi:hypothetical protein